MIFLFYYLILLFLYAICKFERHSQMMRIVSRVTKDMAVFFVFFYKLTNCYITTAGITHKALKKRFDCLPMFFGPTYEPIYIQDVHFVLCIVT